MQSNNVLKRGKRHMAYSLVIKINVLLAFKNILHPAM